MTTDNKCVIPGLCRVWARKVDEPNYWSVLPNAARSYEDCERLVDYYEENWGNFYVYKIVTAADRRYGW